MSLTELTIFKLASTGNITELIKIIDEKNDGKSNQQYNAAYLVQMRDDNGLQLIHLAARGGHTRFVYELLKLGASANE